jgi:hypothetical protein
MDELQCFEQNTPPWSTKIGSEDEKSGGFLEVIIKLSSQNG